jgi:hypothetical protein
MTGAQRIALAHPCLFAFETAHPRYGSLLGAASLVLTVNSGYE